MSDSYERRYLKPTVVQWRELLGSSGFGPAQQVTVGANYLGPVAEDFYRALDQATGRTAAAVWRRGGTVVAPLDAVVDILDDDSDVNVAFEAPGSVKRTQSNLAKAVEKLRALKESPYKSAGDVASAAADVAAWTKRLAEVQASNPGGYKRGAPKTRSNRTRYTKSKLPRRDRHGRFVK
jgi:hypothetical protein